MLNRKYRITAAILGLSIITAGMPVSAAQREISRYGDGVYVVSGQEDINKVKEQLENYGGKVAVIDLTGDGLIDCVIPGIPGTNQPETEAPETQPDTKPEVTPPQTEAPETQPDTKPEVTPPQTEAPETQPETKPEVTPPQTEAPETQPDTKPEVTPPQTEAPETQPDTKPETEAPGNNTISSFAMKVLELTNKEREKEGLPALKYDAAISKAALVRAKESEISFSHTRPDGTSFSTALKEAGVSYRGAGENLAWGQKSPEEVVKGWMNSPGHRANILNKNYTKLGVGHYQNSRGVNYWTQLFTY